MLPRNNYWNRGVQANRLRYFLKSIGLPSVKFHTLRACFATQLLSDGVDMTKVMKIGGWKDIKPTETTKTKILNELNIAEDDLMSF